MVIQKAGRLVRRLAPVLALAMPAALLPVLPAAAAADEPFRDPQLSLSARVEDLLGRLTLDEKVAWLHQYQPAIPRLGVAAFKTGTEALHGVAWSTDITRGGAVVTANGTVFPQAVGLASTWDPALIREVGGVVGDEARGYHALNPGLWGLQLWAPVVNLLRDPRWGRNEEGYSEDPYLTGAISTAYGHGLQGDDPDQLRTAPVLKHYVANNNEVRRLTTSSQLRPRVLREYDDQAFRPAIAADAATGVMTSYNLVNGRPMTANADLLAEVRRWTDRTLFNVTDAGGPGNLVGAQRYYPTLTEADAAILKAGVDSFTANDTNPAPTRNAINTALATGLLTVADVDTAVRHILSVRFRLGEFDPGGGRYGGITPDVIDSPAHRALARRTAADAMVLLKNSAGALPLAAGAAGPLAVGAAGPVAVVGPLADTLYTDWYSGALPYRVTPVDGIAARVGAQNVASSEGVDRIALRDVATGRYVSGGPAEAGADLTAVAAEVGPAEQFDIFDWGQGVLTLRNAANGRYVGRAGGGFRNNQEQPNGWFVQQMFKLEDQGDGTVAVRYAGYEMGESWAGGNHYLTVAADGRLTLGAPTAATAARFTREVVRSGVDSAVAAARGARAAVVVVGSMPFINGREDHDRTDMGLGESQHRLIRAVRAVNPNTVVVVENSYPTTLTWEQENVPAILWTTHAGAETGNALADVLFGDREPAGRLTQTWYRSAADLPDILEYDIIKADRTYQYFRGRPLYEFGHGLSYASFRYDRLRLSAPTAAAGGRVAVGVDVTNTGARAGSEVVQLYTHQRRSRVKQPLRQLREFAKVTLGPGETRRVTLTLDVADLAHWDVTRGRWVVESSAYDVLVGRSSADIRQRAQLRVRGEVVPARDLRRTTRAIDFDDYAGVALVDQTKTHGDAVGAPAAGSWIRFTDVDLRRGAASFTARVARAAAGAAAVEVRLDDPVSGRLVGTAPVVSTGDVYTYATTSAPLAGARGRHDVYLVFAGDLRIADFTLR
ncbi:MAG TPA: glycoside hydrolase family 3 C-terminal domain-containing protein [Pilimelia sp.]|nr:glycoside hydrolase family 3 C-terminal domain-containing protein [Pilimelia sp.]